MDSISFGYGVGNDLEPMNIDSVRSNEVLQRAYLLASVEWTPLRPVPKRGGGYYPANVMVTGVPYSSVKELDTYLFQNVSYHTFMTAVHNPNSVLYTEDISLPPYHGTNCATYYGAVCSSSIMWALGLDVPYYANQIINMPDYFTMNTHQEIDSLRVCDVIWKSGHLQMIYDMEFRADTLYRIKTFETSGPNAHINNYTKDQFLNVWNSNGYVGYRYNKMIYSTEPALFQNWEPIAYNDYLCPSKGDKSVYSTTDTVFINIFDSSYNQIVLVKGASIVASTNYNGNNHQYFGLQPGVYSVFLQRGNERTARVSFEIIETDVSYDWNSDEESINIYFTSSAKPEYAMLCDLDGSSFFYPISANDRWRGYITLSRLNQTEYYCKVLFRGEYGVMINVPIRVEQPENK